MIPRRNPAHMILTGMSFLSYTTFSLNSNCTIQMINGSVPMMFQCCPLRGNSPVNNDAKRSAISQRYLSKMNVKVYASYIFGNFLCRYNIVAATFNGKLLLLTRSLCEDKVEMTWFLYWWYIDELETGHKLNQWYTIMPLMKTSDIRLRRIIRKHSIYIIDCNAIDNFKCRIATAMHIFRFPLIRSHE